MPEPARTITRRLVDAVRSVEFGDIPAAIVALARDVFLDGLGVTMAGSTEPLGLGRIVTQYVGDLGGAEDATVVAGGFKTSVLNAAYANGTMAHALDFDNTWYPLNHPTSPSLPAILALAEKHGHSGRQIVTALVAAFEVQGRLRMASTGLATGKGFHKPGTTGLMGATAAAIALLELDAEEAMMAFGIAGSRAGSLSLNTGTMTKSTHSGNAARMGVEAGVLAKMGWTAHTDIFGPGGFFDTLMGEGNYDAELLVADFGHPFRMQEPGVGFKKYPCNYFTHRGIDAALAVRGEKELRADDIASVDVRFPRFSYVDRPRPRTGLDGKFSVQYTTSAALLDGRVDIDTFTDERRFAPDIESLLPKVHLHFDDAIPNDFATMYTVVSVTFEDGHEVTERVERLTGMWGVPLTPQQLRHKFLYCAERVIDHARAERIVERVGQLEELDDITELMALVRTATNQRT